jgi:hypothetical protein
VDAFNGQQKAARTFSRGNRTSLISGTWLAGGRFPRKANWIRQTREEQFPVERSSVVWLRQEQQAAWFVSPAGRRPLAGVPLAWAVLQRMRANDLPWRGFFRLSEEGWWIIAVDGSGAVHPRWDSWIPHSDYETFRENHATELAAFTHEEICETPEESWDWLLSDARIDNAPVIRPVVAGRERAKKVSITAVAAVAAMWGAMQLISLWHRHEVAEANALAMRLASENAMSAQERAEMTRIQHAAMVERVNQYWQNLPRPWMQWPTWSAVTHACNDVIAGGMPDIALDGWKLSKLRCTVSSSDLRIERTWVRIPLATVFQRPAGTLSADGEEIDSVTFEPLPPMAEHDILASKNATTDWLGWKQQWDGALDIKAAAATPYLPPVPAFVPPAERSHFHSKALWNTATISITADGLPIEPLWPLLNTAGFLPTSVVATLQATNGINWTISGVQYETP